MRAAEDFEASDAGIWISPQLGGCVSASNTVLNSLFVDPLPQLLGDLQRACVKIQRG